MDVLGSTDIDLDINQRAGQVVSIHISSYIQLKQGFRQFNLFITSMLFITFSYNYCVRLFVQLSLALRERNVSRRLLKLCHCKQSLQCPYNRGGLLHSETGFYTTVGKPVRIH